MSDPVKKAEALSADIRHVLRHHKARIDWILDVEGRITLTVVIESPESRTIGRALGRWWQRVIGL